MEIAHLVEECADGGCADVRTGEQVTDEGEAAHERVIAPTRGFVHVLGVGRVEAEGGGGWAVSDQIDLPRVTTTEARDGEGEPRATSTDGGKGMITKGWWQGNDHQGMVARE